MNMSYKRHSVQEYCEAKFRGSKDSEWTSYKSQVASWNINPFEVQELEKANKKDMIANASKALISFIEALTSIDRNHYAWAIVKLYYSIFYSLRFEIMKSRHFLVRCKNVFCGELKESGTIFPLSPRKKQEKGDHQLTIALEEQLVSEGLIIDPVLDNKIDDESPYIWMLKQRERINYRIQEFPDPECDDVLLQPSEYIHNKETTKLLKNYINKTDLSYLFDPGHCMVAVPFFRICCVLNSIDKREIGLRQLVHIRKMAKEINLNLNELLTTLDNKK
ncbi:MAG: hypothetical protein K2G88_04995 [Oscillospiraceae bacterium]|nr:hypothetical protein [Oscillospiraceae bacterium]